MSVRAGRLNQRVRILARQAGQDSFGQERIVWQEVGRVWAAVKTRTGRGLLGDESVIADRDTSRTPVVFEIRRRSGVTADMQIEYRGERYEIRSIDVDEDRREYMNIMTAKGV